ncbi:MAG: hypothetical protein LBS01_07445, partial [Prevotellaceae bacterium]|nr:hypothetical protein [Prevotellaceae bacterium]
FVKSLIGGYALLTFPLCLLPVFGILLIINLLSPIFAFAILALAAFSFLAALFYSVKQNLYKELNLFAL